MREYGGGLRWPGPRQNIIFFDTNDIIYALAVVETGCDHLGLQRVRYGKPDFDAVDTADCHKHRAIRLGPCLLDMICLFSLALIFPLFQEWFTRSEKG